MCEAGGAGATHVVSTRGVSEVTEPSKCCREITQASIVTRRIEQSRRVVSARGYSHGLTGSGLVAPAQRPKVSKTYASTVGLPGLNLAPRYAISKTKVLEGGTL